MSVDSTIATDVRDTVRYRNRLIGRIIRDLILILCLLATVALGLLVAMAHLHVMRVLSPSMEPTISAGDIVLLRPIPATELRQGQIVVLPVPDEGGAVYAHRLIDVRQVGGKTVVTTKGDANPAPDRWELQIESASVPLVIGQIPLPGAVASVAGPRLTQILVIALLALIAAPPMAMLMRRTRVGTRLRVLPVRLSDRRHR